MTESVPPTITARVLALYVIVAAAILLVLALADGLARLARHVHARAPMGVRRRAARSFARAVAEDDWHRADRVARRIFRRAAARARQVDVVDVAVVANRSLEQIATALHDYDHQRRLFASAPNITTCWPTDGGLGFRAWSEHCAIDGHLTVRTVLSHHHASGALIGAVEIRVLAQVTGSPSRRRHRCARAITRAFAHDLQALQTSIDGSTADGRSGG
jgi:hypothetical protein